RGILQAAHVSRGDRRVVPTDRQRDRGGDQPPDDDLLFDRAEPGAGAADRDDVDVDDRDGAEADADRGEGDAPAEAARSQPPQHLLDEAVADAAHGEEELWLLRVALQLLPQMADVDVDGARVAVLGVAPDVLEQRLAAEHPAGRAGERAEDLELDVGDADLLAGEGDEAAVEVDRQVRVDDRATVEALGGGARHPRATQRRFHPTAELAHREGLRYVVVGTDLKPGDLVGLGAFRGQHDDRHLAAGAQLATDFDPVAARQHQVEDDQIEAAFVEALKRFGAVQGGGHVVPLLAQRIAEQSLDRLLVVD